MLLQDTPPHSWHRLTLNPDKIANNGVTDFFVSWSFDPVTKMKQVSTRDDMQSQEWRVSGAHRVGAYLATPVYDSLRMGKTDI